MDSLELLFSRNQVVEHADAFGIVPTTATLKLKRADGTTLQSPVVTKPTATATVVASGSTVAALKLSSVAGFAVGKPFKVTSDGEDYVCTPARIDAATKIVTLLAALPVLPDDASPVAALTMSATITAPGEAELGTGLQLEWAYDDGTNPGYATVEVAVVRWLWQQVLTASDVAERLATIFGGLTKSPEFCRGVAERVDDKIRQAVEQTGRRPWLFVSPRAFSEVAEAALRWVLADMGIAQAGVGDVAQLLREYRFAFQDEMQKVVASLRGYDSDGDGALNAAEKRNVLAIPMVR